MCLKKLHVKHKHTQLILLLLTPTDVCTYIPVVSFFRFPLESKFAMLASGADCETMLWSTNTHITRLRT